MFIFVFIGILIFFSLKGVTNVEFICGKAEDVIFTAINKCDETSDIIAVVDPPRAGLRKFDPFLKSKLKL